MHPAMTTVKALAMGVAAKEATTRTVAMKRSTVWCIAAAEAAIPVQATLTAVAEVPATSSSRTKNPARKTEAPAFPGHKSGESESKALQRIHLFSPLFLSCSLFSGSSSADDVKRNRKIEVNRLISLIVTEGTYMS